MCAILGKFGRGEVDCDSFIREAKPRVDDCGAYAFAGFRNGFVCHADDVEAR